MNKFVRCVNTDAFYTGPWAVYPQPGKIYKVIAEELFYLRIERFSGSWSKTAFVNVEGCPCSLKNCVAAHKEKQ